MELVKILVWKEASVLGRFGRSGVGLALLVAGALFGTAGCARDFIPNTEVEDSDFNRRVIEFCEDYRHAVERGNTGELLKLADAKYYEDGGTVDTSDDLDFAGLKDYLNGKFKYTRQIRYAIHYRDISAGRTHETSVATAIKVGSK